MLHVVARHERDMAETVYRAYVTDTLRGLGRGEYPSARWVEIITRDVTADIDADEVIRGLVDAGAFEVTS